MSIETMETYKEATAAALLSIIQGLGSPYATRPPVKVRVDVEWTANTPTLHVERVVVVENFPNLPSEVTYQARVHKNWFTAIYLAGLSKTNAGWLILDAKILKSYYGVEGVKFYEVSGPAPDESLARSSGRFREWGSSLASYGGLMSTGQSPRDALNEVLKAHQHSLGLPMVGLGGINLHPCPAVSEEDE